MLKSTLPTRKPRIIYKADTTHDRIYDVATTVCTVALVLIGTMAVTFRYFMLSDFQPTVITSGIATAFAFTVGGFIGAIVCRVFSTK